MPPRTRSCKTINEYEARLTINGVYAKLPAGEFTVAESWSGDIVGAQWYLPEGHAAPTCWATGDPRPARR